MPIESLLIQALKTREMQAERTINLIRGVGIILAALFDFGYKVIHDQVTTTVIIWMTAMLVIPAIYTLIVHKLTSDGEYRAWLKYLTISVDYTALTTIFVLAVEFNMIPQFSVEILYGVFVAWLFLASLLSAFRQGRLVVTFSTILATLAATIIAFLYLESAFFLYSAILITAFGLLVGILSAGNTHLFLGLRRKEQLMRFVSRSLMERIEAGEVNLALGGVKRKVTILMTDIRDFTRFAETRDPLEVVDTLNEYFTAMTAIVFENGGTIDKFIGDAILAVFGAVQEKPDDAERALRAAEQMNQKLKQLNQAWASQGRPPLSMGAGLHTGDVVIGNIGSPERMEYTVVGDTVNVASRIESLNKRYGTRLLFSESTQREIDSKRQATSVGVCQVRGRTLPVKLYSLAS